MGSGVGDAILRTLFCGLASRSISMPSFDTPRSIANMIFCSCISWIPPLLEEPTQDSSNFTKLAHVYLNIQMSMVGIGWTSLAYVDGCAPSPVLHLVMLTVLQDYATGTELASSLRNSDINNSSSIPVCVYFSCSFFVQFPPTAVCNCSSNCTSNCTGKTIYTLPSTPYG